MNSALLPCKDKVVKMKSSKLPKYFSMFLFVSLRCSPFKDSSTPSITLQKLTSTLTDVCVLFTKEIIIYIGNNCL